jgi:hypothetical protein
MSNMLTWTSHKPTTPGWYWWRRLKGDRTIEYQCITEVINIHGKLFMNDTGDTPLNYYATERFKNGVQKNEWAGPLLPPGEAA